MAKRLALQKRTMRRKVRTDTEAAPKPGTSPDCSFEAPNQSMKPTTPNSAKAHKVIANGVTIDSGAQFNFVVAANKTLTPGKVFVAISNTAATPIAGTFANLPDVSTITIGSNTFQANYEGGDGNDLTLTVVP